MIKVFLVCINVCKQCIRNFNKQKILMNDLSITVFIVYQLLFWRMIDGKMVFMSSSVINDPTFVFSMKNKRYCISFFISVFSYVKTMIN